MLFERCPTIRKEAHWHNHKIEQMKLTNGKLNYGTENKGKMLLNRQWGDSNESINSWNQTRDITTLRYDMSASRVQTAIFSTINIALIKVDV